ncbi:uncharacterized protein LOC123656539 [Melitaea cinxia]|uniref:uncharacterized protein LOC123656539 n=1 Tax=Melitaea cinxia TaxID=113334 RepID=UPI001E273C00|nr:uncharacterized protein LOC123656539 [Melitaea cinxia]
MRTIGDVELNRRAPIDKKTTAGPRELIRRTPDVDATADSSGDETNSLFTSVPSTCPSYMTRKSLNTNTSLESVVQDVNIDTELAPIESAHNRRRRWTREMNTFILRTYLQLTELNLDTRSYLEPLHSKFTEKFPNMQVSRQRIGDQRKAIVRNKLLPQNIIDQIYDEVKTELTQMNNSISSHYTQKPKHHHALQVESVKSQTHCLPSEVPIVSNTTQRRMRWTREHNEAIIRSYYRITSLGLNNSAYRKQLYNDFINRFPSLTFLNEQRVADQRRAIVNNKYIDSNRLSELKLEVSKELQVNSREISNCIDVTNSVCDNTNIQFTNNSKNTIQQPSVNNQSLIMDTVNDSGEPQSEIINGNRHLEIDQIFQQTFEFYKNTEPENRTYIPKQKPSKKFANIVNYLNEVTIPENVNENTDFLTLQTIIYCAAFTAAKANGSKINLQIHTQHPKNKTEHKPNWQKRLE